MIVVGYNFDKYLALASGLSVTGQGLGLLVFSILLNFCFEYYGLKGTFLFMACLTLQKLVFGSLLQPSTIEMAQTKRFWHKEPPSTYPDGDIELEVRKETTSVMLKVHYYYYYFTIMILLGSLFFFLLLNVHSIQGHSK